jgi:hypothetical protein
VGSNPTLSAITSCLAFIQLRITNSIFVASLSRADLPDPEPRSAIMVDSVQKGSYAKRPPASADGRVVMIANR